MTKNKKILIGVGVIGLAAIFFFLKKSKEEKYQKSCRKYVDCLLSENGQDCESVLANPPMDCECRQGEKFVKCT